MAYPVIESSAGANSITPVSSLTINKPTDTAEGDLLLAIINADGNPTITAPGGWTAYTQATAGTAVTGRFFSLRAGASEPANYEFPLSSSVAVTGVIERISGASSAILYDSSTHSGAETTTTAPTVTVPSDESLVFRIAFTDGNALPSEPVGYTTIYSGGSASFSFRGVYKQQAVAGATGTEDFTHSSAIGGAQTLVVIQPVDNIVSAGLTYVATVGTGDSTVSAGMVYAATVGVGNSVVSAAFLYVATTPPVPYVGGGGTSVSGTQAANTTQNSAVAGTQAANTATTNSVSGTQAANTTSGGAVGGTQAANTSSTNSVSGTQAANTATTNSVGGTQAANTASSGAVSGTQAANTASSSAVGGTQAANTSSSNSVGGTQAANTSSSGSVGGTQAANTTSGGTVSGTQAANISNTSRSGGGSAFRSAKTPRFNPVSLLDGMDNTVGYVQWRAFIGPPFRKSTDGDFYDWSALTLAAYTPSPTDTTLSSGVVAIDTVANLTSAASFPSAGGLWLGPNAGGESWGYATYTGKSTNQLTGLTRDTVDGEYTGVHTSGAVARFWWPLDTATAAPVLREVMDSSYSTVGWEATIGGIVAPIPAMRSSHLFLMQKRELSGGAWGDWTNWLIGWTLGSNVQDDAQKERPWTLQVAGLNGMLSQVEVTGLRVGPPDIADDASISVSSTLSPAYKEANTGEFTGSNPNVSPSAMVDNDTSTPWISGGFVGGNNTVTGDAFISQVHVSNYPGQGNGYRWVELTFGIDSSGEKNVGVGVDYFVPFKDSTVLDYSAGDRAILTENPVLFAEENPDSKAAAALDLSDYQLWDRNNNKQTVSTGGATGGTFTIAWNRTGAWVLQKTGNIPYNASASAIAAAFTTDTVYDSGGTPMATQINAEDIYVTGPAGGPWVITFCRYHGSTGDIFTLVLDTALLTTAGTPSVVRTRDGGSAFDVTASDGRNIFDYMTATDGVLTYLQIATDIQQALVWGTSAENLRWAQGLPRGLPHSGDAARWTGAAITAPTAGQTIRATDAAAITTAAAWNVSKVATPGYVVLTATKEWLYFDLPTMGLTLVADIDNAVTSIAIGKEGEISVDGLPATGTIQVGIEQITYTAINRTTGVISGGARGANSTTAVLHLAGDTVYFVASGVATEGYPVDTVQLIRPTGFSVPANFIVYGSVLTAPRNPDDANYTDDYTVLATVVGNVAETYSLDLSATAPRIRVLLVEVTAMSETPSRVKINEVRVLVDGDVLDSTKYLASGTVAQAIDILVLAAGVPAAATTDVGDTQTVTEYTTQTDLVWPVIVDLAEFTNTRITVGRDSKITFQADPFWSISGTPAESSELTRTSAAHIEINKSPVRTVGQIELTWRPPDSETEDIATFPATYTTGRKVKVGPYVYADAAAALAGATKRYYQMRRPYDAVVELATQGDTIRAGTVRGLNWILHDSQLAQDRTYLCIQSAHTIRNFGWNSVLTLLQLNRTDEL